MKNYRAENMVQLLDIIGAGCPDPRMQGPVVVRVDVWNGKTIEGAYGQKLNGKFLVGDVETADDVFVDVEPIRSFAERLLKTGENSSLSTATPTQSVLWNGDWRTDRCNKPTSKKTVNPL